MKTMLHAAVVALAMTLPAAIAGAQTVPPATSAPAQDPHHPSGQESGAPPATGSSPGGSTAAPVAGAPPAQMGMMMGDMRQMMGMMQQMMQMMGGGMPMMGMMRGGPDGGPGMGPGRMPGQPSDGMGPGMFRHTEGILAFYKAELRITEAQAAPWNAFAEAVRAHVKTLREAMQRTATQRAAATAPEQLDQRVMLLTAQLDAAKAIATTGKALYAALNPEQRKLADDFMADHLRGMRGMKP